MHLSWHSPLTSRRVHIESQINHSVGPNLHNKNSALSEINELRLIPLLARALQ